VFHAGLSSEYRGTVLTFALTRSSNRMRQIPRVSRESPTGARAKGKADGRLHGIGSELTRRLSETRPYDRGSESPWAGFIEGE
jgi:hypothetical protein